MSGGSARRCQTGAKLGRGKKGTASNRRAFFETLEPRRPLAVDFAAIPLWNGEATFPEAFENGVVQHLENQRFNLFGGPTYDFQSNTRVTWTNEPQDVHSGRGAFRVQLDQVSNGNRGEFALMLAEPGLTGRNTRDLTPYRQIRLSLRNDTDAAITFEFQVRDSEFRRAVRTATIPAHSSWTTLEFSLPADAERGWTVVGAAPDLHRAREFSFQFTASAPVSGDLLIDDMELVEQPWTSNEDSFIAGEASYRLSERQFRSLWGARDQETGLMPVNSTFPDLMGLNVTAAMVQLAIHGGYLGWIDWGVADEFVGNLVNTLNEELDQGYQHLPPRLLHRVDRGPLALVDTNLAPNDPARHHPEESPIDAALLVLALARYSDDLPVELSDLRTSINSLVTRFDFAPFFDADQGWKLGFDPETGEFSDLAYAGYTTEVYVMSLAAAISGDVPIEDSFLIGPDREYTRLTEFYPTYLVHSQERFRAGFEQSLLSLFVDVSERGEVVVADANGMQRWPNPESNARNFRGDQLQWLSDNGRDLQAPPDAADNGMGGHGEAAVGGPHGESGNETYHAYSPWFDNGEADLTMPWALAMYCNDDQSLLEPRLRAHLELGLHGPFGLADSAVWPTGETAPTRWNGRADLWNSALSTLAFTRCASPHAMPFRTPSIEDQLDRVFALTREGDMDLSRIEPENGGDGADGVVLRGTSGGGGVWSLGSLGSSANWVGDLNGDGFDDLFLTDPTATQGGSVGMGVAVFGGTAAAALAVDQPQPGETTLVLMERASVVGANAGNYLGENGSKLVVGLAGDSSSTQAVGLNLVANNWPAEYVISFPRDHLLATNNSQGDVVAIERGNVDGDAHDDLLVATSTGRVYLVLGRSPESPTRSLSVDAIDVTPGGATPRFSRPSVTLVDFNQDGYDDLVFAGQVVGPVGPETTIAYIVSGNRDWSSFAWNDLAFDGWSGWRVKGAEGSSAIVARSHNEVASLRDGVILGLPEVDVLGIGESAGQVVVLAPAYRAVQGVFDLRQASSKALDIRGGAASQRLGAAVAGLGDFDGDGYGDLAIHSPGLARVDVFSGRGFAMFSSLNFGSRSLADWQGFLLPELASDDVQFSNRPGDMNGDGVLDLVVGVPGAEGGGKAYVIYGGRYSRKITHLGAETNDTIRGGAGVDHMVGGVGDDWLDLGTGYNFARQSAVGGVGDDTFVLQDSEPVYVDGGAGVDRLVLSGAGISLAIGPSTVKNVEVFDMRGTDANELNFDVHSSQAWWLPRGGTLMVYRDEDDYVSLNERSSPVTTQIRDGVVFDEYRIDQATVLVQQAPDRDFGDAMRVGEHFGDSFPTLLNRNGARHILGGPRLGERVDVDFNGGTLPESVGDDREFPATDFLESDDDGVEFPSSMIVDDATGGVVAVSIHLSHAASAKLDAWIDFNADGDWDEAGEQIFASRTLFVGDNSLSIVVPPGVARHDVTARFRVSSAGGLTPAGLAADGEVEDYELSFPVPSVTSLAELLPENGGDGSLGTAFRRNWNIDDSRPISLGDFNGDGFDDFAIGSPYTNDGGAIGESYLVFGKGDGLPPRFDLATLAPEQGGNGANGFVIVADAYTGNIGMSLSGRGDFNGDGLHDLLLGATYYFWSNNAGAAFVIYGTTESLGAEFSLSSLEPRNGGDGSRGFALLGIDFRDDVGSAAAFGGDVNGDGYDDLIVAAPQADLADQRDAGELYVVYGSSLSPAAEFELKSLWNGDARLGRLIVGFQADRRAGSIVSPAGDVNSDGWSDWLVGTSVTPGVASLVTDTYLLYGGDFSGWATAVGELERDYLLATDATDVQLGRWGDDYFWPVKSGDTAMGGAGNDAFEAYPGYHRIDGGSGYDRIDFSGYEETVYLSDFVGPRIQNIEQISFRILPPKKLVVDPAAVAGFSKSSNLLTIVSGSMQEVQLAGEWSFSRGEVFEDRFFETYSHGATEVRISDDDTHWTHPTEWYDVNNDRVLSPLDALLIVNELNQRQYSISSGFLLHPRFFDKFPGFFFDVDADNHCIPRDALLVIQRLNDRPLGESESESPFASRLPSPLMTLVETPQPSPLLNLFETSIVTAAPTTNLISRPRHAQSKILPKAFPFSISSSAWHDAVVK